MFKKIRLMVITFLMTLIMIMPMTCFAKSISSIAHEKFITMYTSETYQLNPIVSPSDYTGKVIYTVSDLTVAVVDSKGKVTPLKEGDVIVTIQSAENTEIKTEVCITIKEKIDRTHIALTGLTLEKEYYETIPHKNFTIKVTPKPFNATSKIKWRTYNENIAKVDSNGVVTGVKPGYIMIEAYSEEDETVFDMCMVRVKRPTIVSSTPKKFKMNIGDKLTIKLKGKYDKVNYAKWSVDRSRYIGLKNKKKDRVTLVAKSKGTAKIKVKARTSNGTCKDFTFTVTVIR